MYESSTLTDGALLADGAPLTKSALLTDGALLADSAPLTDGTLLADGTLLTDGALLADGPLLTDSALLTDGALLTDSALLTDGALLADISWTSFPSIPLVRPRRYVRRGSRAIVHGLRGTFGDRAKHACTCKHERGHQRQSEFARHSFPPGLSFLNTDFARQRKLISVAPG